MYVLNFEVRPFHSVSEGEGRNSEREEKMKKTEPPGPHIFLYIGGNSRLGSWENVYRKAPRTSVWFDVFFLLFFGN